MSNIICSACYKSINKDSVIVCQICQIKLHKFCAKIDNDKAVAALSNFANIVYNCDNCLHSSSDLVKKVNFLTFQMDEMKLMLSQFISSKNVNNNNLNQSHRSSSLLQTGLEYDSRSKNDCLSTVKSSNFVPSIDGSSFSVVGNTATVCSTDSSGAASVDIPVAVDAADSVDVVTNANNEVPSLPNDDLFADAVSEVALVAGSAANTEWTNVTRRKQHKRRVVVGLSVNTELDVVTKMKWVHLASFKPTVTADRVLSYVADHLKIDKKTIACYPLIKKDMTIDNLKYLNFKLGVPPEIYDNLFRPELWTANIKVRPFKFFPKRMPQPLEA